MCAAVLLCLHTLVPHVHHHAGEGEASPEDKPAWLILLKDVVGADIGTQHLQHLSTADADPEMRSLAENAAGWDAQPDYTIREYRRPSVIGAGSVPYTAPAIAASNDHPPADPLRGPPCGK